MTPHRTAPLEFKVVQPVRGLEQRRSMTDRCPSEPNPVGGAAIVNLLSQVSRFFHGVGIALERKHLDRLSDVFQLLRSNRAKRQRQFAVNLLEGLSGDADAARLGNAFAVVPGRAATGPRAAVAPRPDGLRVLEAPDLTAALRVLGLGATPGPRRWVE